MFIHMNNNKFAYDEFKIAKFGYNIFDMFQSSYIIIVYFLDQHRRQRGIQHFQQFFYSPTLLQTGQTNLHTHNNRVLILKMKKLYFLCFHSSKRPLRWVCHGILVRSCHRTLSSPLILLVSIFVPAVIICISGTFYVLKGRRHWFS